MKTRIIFPIFLTATVLLTVILSGCGGPEPNSAGLNAKENVCRDVISENVTLKKRLENMPSEEELLAEAREFIEAENRKKRASFYWQLLDTLDYSAIPVIGVSRDYNISSIEQLQRGENGFKGISTRIAWTLNMNRDVLKNFLENPAILRMFFNANKKTIPVVLKATGLTYVAKGTAAELLPYFNGTAPKDRIESFDAFFLLHKSDGYINNVTKSSGSDVSPADWNIVMEKTGLDSEALDRQYRMYLFAKRRAMTGNPELVKECTEILQFLAKLE